jgi:hypothetical protein
MPPKPKSPAEIAKEQKENESAILIQCMARKAAARMLVVGLARRTWRRVFDPEFKIYFWFNTLNGQSQWHVPKYTTLHTEKDTIGAKYMQNIVRGFIGRRRAQRKAVIKWTRFFDSNQNKFYWMTNDDSKTFWNASAWLVKQEIPMPAEDQMLFDQFQKIKAMEDALKAKDEEIKTIRKLRYEELEPQVVLDRIASVRNLTRSKNMDEWSIDEIGAFFVELKMEEHIPFVYQNRIDGLLFINLADDDWEDMGIKSRFQRRKLQLILKAFRFRYQKKKAKEEFDEDDELISEYSPSELSDIINQEDDEDDDLEVPTAADDESDVDSEEEDIGKKQEEILITNPNPNLTLTLINNRRNGRRALGAIGR